MIETGRLEVRRSRVQALLQAGTLAALLALGVSSLVHAYLTDAVIGWTPLLTGGFLTALMGVYLAQMIVHLRDRSPVVVVSADGLFVPAALGRPIPWQSISRVDCIAGLIGKGRVEIEVDPELYAQMRFGHRLFGDYIVRRPASRTRFSMLAQGFDCRAIELYGAIRRFWQLRRQPV